MVVARDGKVSIFKLLVINVSVSFIKMFQFQSRPNRPAHSVHPSRRRNVHFLKSLCRKPSSSSEASYCKVMNIHPMFFNFDFKRCQKG
jgi:hypothetical protein